MTQVHHLSKRPRKDGMTAIFSGFSVIWIIIGVGFAIGRLGMLGPDSRVIMSRVAFFVASPCLLFLTISDSSIQEVLGPQFLIAGMGAFLALAIFMILGKFLILRGRSASELMVGGLSASLANSANLGFPIAAYVLGDVSFAAPLVMFQLAVFTPLYVIVLDFLTRSPTPTSAQVRPSRPVAVVRSIGQSMGNPMIIGSMAGLVFSWQGWSLPGPIHESVELLAGASIPLMLLAFGLSLVGSHPLDKKAGRRSDVLLASVIKLVVHPLAAFAVAVLIFGAQGEMLLAAVVMASLPSAQNVLVSAIRYNTGEVIARDTVLVTTVLAIPAMLVVALLLA